MALWPALLLGSLVAVGIAHLRYEHDYPTPRDWTFWSRWSLRNAITTEQTRIKRAAIDWSKAGYYYLDLLRRLEDETIDGKDLIQGETLVAGVGRTGLDISNKSDQWRRGYYQALMGAGRVAEHMEGMAKRKGEERGKPIPWDSVPGPSNPRPKPLPWDKKGRHRHVPSELECEDAYPQPERFYMKILTNRGFTNGERLDAALAYADWCEFKGLQDTAANMYDWALDIAVGGLPMGADHVVDIRTGVINKGKEEYVTANLLKATTALGTYHARQGEVKQALPIFLSVLRARKALLPKPAGYVEPAQPSTAKSEFQAYWTAIKEALFDTPYPALPRSGDERPYHSLKEACEEVGLMTYIGEILFATSENDKEKGLSWTRDSVEAAEAVMWVMDEQNEHDGHEKCRECLETGLSNWKEMITEMERLSLTKEQKAEKSNGWFGTSIGKGPVVDQAKNDLERWKEEQAQIELRQQKTMPLITLSRANAPVPVAWG